MFDYEFNVIDYDGYLYLYIGGESDSKSPATMNKEIDMKIKTFRSTLALLSQKEFNTIKARTSLHSKLRFDSLETKAHKVWKEIYLSTTSACSLKNIPSKSVLAITGSKELASNSLRISLSHLTTKDEIDKFLQEFQRIYKELS